MRALILAGTPPPSGIPVTPEPSLLRFLPLSFPLPSGTLTQHSPHRRLPYFPRPKSNLSVSPTDFAPREGLWEDPDAESDDEDDDGGVGIIGGEDDEIPDGVASLLSAEEKAILQQNHGPDLSKISTKKWNPLHALALSGQIQIIDQILECGVHVDSVDKDGFTALHKAVIGKKESVISYLLKKGATPHVRDRDGATALHHAVQVGAIQTVKLLIKHKVDVNVADNEGWTPLHVAMQSRSRDIGKILLVNGADKTRRNKDGNTPLDLSLCFGKDFKSYELAKLIKLVPANRYL